jgi:DNA-binding CsgD family transcriptional regulator
VGKTTVAKKVATELYEAGVFADGVCWIDFSETRESSEDPSEPRESRDDRVQRNVWLTVQDRLKLRSGDRGSLETISDWLDGSHDGKKKEVLIVLNAFDEHVQTAALSVRSLLESHPDLKVLVTSHISKGELARVATTIHIDPLPLPDRTRDVSPGQIVSFDSVQLFMKHAQLWPDEENAGAIAEICRLVDGLPLAIELLAAICRPDGKQVKSPKRLLGEMRGEDLVLSGHLMGANLGYRGMEEAISFSYKRLDPNLQDLFRRLAIFGGSFTEASACEVGGIAPKRFRDGIHQLTIKNLVEPATATAVSAADMRDIGPARFILLQPIRSFGRRALRLDPAHGAIRDAYLQWCLAIASKPEPDRHSGTPGHGVRDWLGDIDSEYGNLCAALEWFLHDQSQPTNAVIDLIASLLGYWMNRDLTAEGQQWAQLALERGSSISPLKRAELLLANGWFALKQCNFSLAEQEFTKSARLFEEAGSGPAEYGIADALRALATYEAILGNYEKASAYDRGALDHAIRLGYRRGIADALRHLGIVETVQGNYADAAGHLEQAREICEERGSLRGLAGAERGLGRIAFIQGNIEEARVRYQASLDHCLQVGYPKGECASLRALASVEALMEGPLSKQSAKEHARASIRLAGSLGFSSGVAEALYVQATIVLREDLNEAEKLAEQSLSLFIKHGIRLGIVDARSLLGKIARTRGDFQTAETYLTSSLRVAEEIGYRRAAAAAKRSLGHIARSRGNYDAAQEFYQSAVDGFRALNLSLSEAITLRSMGHLARVREDTGGAIVHYEAALKIFKALPAGGATIGDLRGIAATYLGLGKLNGDRGDRQAAEKFLKDSKRIFEMLGDNAGIAGASRAIGDLALTKSKLKAMGEAAGHFRNVIELARAIGYRPAVIKSLPKIAEIAERIGEPSIAARLCGAEQRWRLALEIKLAPERVRIDYEALIERLMQGLGYEYHQSFLEGQRLSWDEAMEQAIDVVQSALSNKRLVSLSGTVTPRELEVLIRLAQGDTNSEIAEVLQITERTVNSHTTSIYNKLGVNSRTAAVSKGIRLGLLPSDVMESGQEK